MKVHFLSVVPSPYQRDLFQALARRKDCELHVYYLEDASPDSPWPDKALRDFETVMPGRWYAWGLSRFHFNALPPALLEADVLVLNGYMNSLAQRLLRAWLEPDCPVLFWGERIRAEFHGLKGWLQKRFSEPLANVDAVVGIGKMAVEGYRERFPGKAVYNIPYYIDVSEYAGAGERGQGPIKILFCGQMIARKGLDLLLKAFESVVGAQVDARLQLIGREAELPAMLETISPAVRERVDYLGFKAPEDLPGYFRQADLFVLPSRFDGWGVVVNQAVASGLPVIATTAVGAAHDLVEDEQNGMLIEADTLEPLRDALLKLCQDGKCREAMGRASLERAPQLDPAVGAARWMEVLEEVLRK